MTSDLDRWLSAICANTAEDAVRLEFADWLEERSATADGWRECPKRPPDNTRGLGLNGCGKPCPVCHGANRISNRYAEWAKFIRVQVELAGGPRKRNWESCDCGACQEGNGVVCFVEQRERELWPFVRERFTGDGWTAIYDETLIPFLNPPGEVQKPIVVVRRGFPSEVRGRLEALTGGECQWCVGRGHFEWYPADDPTNSRMEGPVTMSCHECHGTGRTPGIGPRVVAEWPVTEVATEKRALTGESVKSFRWVRGGEMSYELPVEIFDRLPTGPTCVLVRDAGTDWNSSFSVRDYESETAANAALSAALIAWAEAEAQTKEDVTR